MQDADIGFVVQALSRVDLATLRSYFPEGDFDCHPFRPTRWMLRFELGGDHPNGSSARVMQSAARAGVLFRSLFAAETPLLVLIEQWGAKLRSGPLLREVFGGLPEAESAPPCECCEQPQRIRLFEWRWQGEAVDRILAATANAEQGFSPKLQNRVWFFDTDKRCAFHMYDDRGCYAFFDLRVERRAMRHQHDEWLAENQRGPGAWS